jgi:hypothetical protein
MPAARRSASVAIVDNSDVNDMITSFSGKTFSEKFSRNPFQKNFSP